VQILFAYTNPICCADLICDNFSERDSKIEKNPDKKNLRFKQVDYRPVFLFIPRNQ